jgi:hypothetical protein
MKEIRQEEGTKAKKLFYEIKPKDFVSRMKRREELYKKNVESK